MHTYDVETVRRFAAEIATHLKGCNEGDFCSDLNRHLHCLADETIFWLIGVKDWATKVYRGEVLFDAEAEAEFKAQLERVALKSRPHIQHATEVRNECYDFGRLDELARTVSQIESMLKNWVRPTLSVMPGPRVKLPAEVAKEISVNAAVLPPLPHGWHPKDRRQYRIFKGE